MASSSILEPMVLLYRFTGEPRYLEFARYIVNQWETEDGPKLVSKALFDIDVARRFPHPERWFAPEQGQKAYEMMSCYDGLLASMADEGSTFAMYTPLVGTHNLVGGQCGMELNCCNANAPQAFMLLPRLVFMTDDDGVVVNLFTEGQASVQFEGNEIQVSQFTDYPVTGNVELKISPPRTAEFTVKLRIPKWSSQTSVTVNGVEIQGVSPGKYTSITRSWSKGDSIQLVLDMRGKVEFLRDGNHLHASVHRGPILLVRDSRFDAIDEDEIAQPQLEGDGYFELTPVESGEAWMLFTGKFLVGSDLEGPRHKPIELYLCDFASAGNTWDYRSRYRVWLPQPLDPTKP